MTWKSTLVAVALMAGAAAALFWIFQRQIAGPSPAFHLPADILPALERSLEDQKLLAALEPAAEAEYRERFDALETTVGRLRILEHNRERLVRRYEFGLLVLLALSVALATVHLASRHAAYAPRLARIQEALARLAQGQGPVVIGDTRRDSVGRISRMIEATSIEMVRDRRRLRSLRNLSGWQEAAKRQAHEMRTPLTGARLTLDRIRALASASPAQQAPEVHTAIEDLSFELDRLARFGEGFASFARLKPPDLRLEDLGDLIREFAMTYESAWPNLTLEVDGENSGAVLADRALIRQVLANLCDNSSKALGDDKGRVRLVLERSTQELRLHVIDDAGGIPEGIRGRLFEPYTTTRAVGDGAGLGLAISHKILLDHGGDLELVDSGGEGTTFVLTLPVPSDR